MLNDTPANHLIHRLSEYSWDQRRRLEIPALEVELAQLIKELGLMVLSLTQRIQELEELSSQGFVLADVECAACGHKWAAAIHPEAAKQSNNVTLECPACGVLWGEMQPGPPTGGPDEEESIEG